MPAPAPQPGGTAFGTLLPIVGSGPERFVDRLGGPFDKSCIGQCAGARTLRKVSGTDRDDKSWPEGAAPRCRPDAGPARTAGRPELRSARTESASRGVATGRRHLVCARLLLGGKRRPHHVRRSGYAGVGDRSFGALVPKDLSLRNLREEFSVQRPRWERY
jgi:hypothetical protein